MRIDEFANAESQLELWKLINQSVIKAIDTQRHHQAQEQARKQTSIKANPKKRGGSKGARPTVPIPTPTPPLPKPLASPQSKKQAAFIKASAIQAQQFPRQHVSNLNKPMNTQGVKPQSRPVSAEKKQGYGVDKSGVAYHDMHSANGYPTKTHQTLKSVEGVAKQS